jgi:hypothetical protein
MKMENKRLSNSNLLLFVADSIFLFLVIQKLSIFLPVEIASYTDAHKFGDIVEIYKMLC